MNEETTTEVYPGIYITLGIRKWGSNPISYVNGSIETSLKITNEEDEKESLYNAAINGFESFLLALAVAGVDVLSLEIQESIKTTLDSISNYYLIN
jgi:hypothetical protein